MAIEWLIGFNSQVQGMYREWQAAVRAGDRERVRELATAIARHISITPLNHRLWRMGDLRRVAIVYGVAWLIIAHHALTGGGPIALVWGNLHPLELALLLVNLLPILFSSLVNLLTREQAQGTVVFLRLTRLGGQDFLYGAYTAYVLGGVMRAYLIFAAPLLLLLATAGYESLWQGLWFVARYGLGLIAFGALWQTLLAFLTLARPSLLAQSQVQAFIVLVVLALMSLGWVVAQLSQRMGLEWFESAPMWLWGAKPLFWLSVLFPPLASLMGVKIAHPLWGIPQGLLALMLVRLLAPYAARRLQRLLNAPEPEPQVQEGGWW
ncbi:MAG: hypothetical protein ACK4UU_00680 [Fimbriimonadales bacterium]